MNETRANSDPGARLCLVAAARNDAAWIACVEAALAGTRPATLILTPPEGAALTPEAARPLIALAHAREIAALIVDDAAAARASGADGVHLTWRQDIAAAYAAARSALGAGAIVGADAGTSRHDAMTLGEAGADYIAFAREPRNENAADEQAELIAWWVDLFVVPVVAFGLETADEAAELAELGADFLAVRLPDEMTVETAEAWALALGEALRAPAGAA